MNFYKLLSTFVGHFCPPGSGSGSTDPIEYGSNADPDPQPCLIYPYLFQGQESDSREQAGRPHVEDKAQES
jgi:hypothetical protein